MVCEAHQKALAAVATLEEEIERLGHTRNCSQLRARSKNRDCQWQSREGQKRRCCQVWFEDQPALSHSANPKTEPGDQRSNGEGSDVGELLKLKLMVASFLRGSPKTSEDESKKMPLEPMVLEFSHRVPWKAEICETPKWWTKLSTVPGTEVCRKLAREVQASFRLPWWMQELGAEEATLPGSSCAAMPL